MDTDSADPRRQLLALWAARWLILGMSCLFGLLAAVAAFTATPKYEGIIELSPVSPNSSGGSFGSSGSGELSGLAALAGLSTGDTAKSEAVAVLQSENLTERYIEQNDLLPILYSKYWDAQKNQWKTSAGDKIPTLWRANRDFGRDVRKLTTTKAGIVVLTITWRDPRLAAKWANGLVKLANDYLRDKAIRESERNIAYLNGEAAKTSIVEAREAIFSIMRNEINKAMIARGSDEFAFKIIDPAVVPDLPSSPRKTLWILAGLAAGFALAIFVVTVRSTYKI